MLKPAKQPHIRLTALFLCVTMFLSTLFFNAHTAYAADGTIDYKAGAKNSIRGLLYFPHEL